MNGWRALFLLLIPGTCYVRNMIYENEHNVQKKGETVCVKAQPHPKGAFVAFAIIAAALYALSTPVSKILLAEVPGTMMAALLYLGAGAGMAVVGAVRAGILRAAGTPSREERLALSDAPYVAAMIALDIVAPILLMAGLSTASAESVSLLNNFEIVATALIALLMFHEPVSKRLWAAIALITAACALLSLDGPAGLEVTPGSLFVLAASVCWGLENNCTNRLSAKDPLQVVVVKGFGSGTGALLVAFVAGDAFPPAALASCALLLGFAAYGLSIFFYVHAQRGLGAARTSAYYALSPFIGVALAWAIFQDPPNAFFIAALALMIAGAYLAAPRGD